jgi:Cu/Ag efflux pump CusA
MHLTPATLEATIGSAMVSGALGFGEPGSEIQVLLALVVVCRSVSSTALNLFVVPATYRASTRRAII